MACTDVPVELGNMSPHLAEAMLVVEDMPILKRINVMVGITRSKVIGGIPTILKNMSSSMGRMTSHISSGYLT